MYYSFSLGALSQNETIIKKNIKIHNADILILTNKGIKIDINHRNVLNIKRNAKWTKYMLFKNLDFMLFNSNLHKI